MYSLNHKEKLTSTVFGNMTSKSEICAVILIYWFYLCSKCHLDEDSEISEEKLHQIKNLKASQEKTQA